MNAKAVAGYQAAQFIGLPECSVNLAQVVVYLAQAPKSNQLYSSYNRVKKVLQEEGSHQVPLHIRNGVTQLMRDLNYGTDYKYPHDFPDAKVDQEYLPLELRGRKFWDMSDEDKGKFSC
jgi:putative ATPase